MKDHSSAQDAMQTNQADLVVGEVDIADAIFVEDHVAKVAYVAILVFWMTVFFLELGKNWALLKATM